MRTGLDDLDARIVSALQPNGRLPNTELARRLRVAEATVRKRIDRLLRDGLMQVGAWTDPLKIGYQHYAIIEVQVHPPRIERVAARLATFSEIFFLGICTGGYDIFATALFRSNAHMHEFLTKRLARVSGIQRTSTTSVIQIVKREYTYSVPRHRDAAVAGRGAPNRRGARRVPRSLSSGRSVSRSSASPSDGAAGMTTIPLGGG